MRQRARILALILLVAFDAAGQHARAANLTVNCDKKETIHKAMKLLGETNAQGPNTITVSGSCRENILIQSMDRLTLITKERHLDHGSFQRNFRGRGDFGLAQRDRGGGHHQCGLVGIGCYTASTCYLTGNTVQASGIGIPAGGGSGTFLESNVTQTSPQPAPKRLQKRLSGSIHVVEIVCAQIKSGRLLTGGL